MLQNFRSDGSFTRNFAFTFSGNAVALILQVFVSPVVTRLYTPEAYGIFAIFNSIVVNFSLVISCGYSSAILSNNNRHKVYGLIVLSSVISLIITVLGLLILVLFKEIVIDFFNIQQLGFWIYLIPISSLLISLNIITSSFFVFKNKVKRDTTIVTASNIINRVFNISYGFAVPGNNVGLIFGDLIGKSSRFVMLVSGVKLLKLKNLVGYSANRLFEIAREFQNYPKFIMPSTLLNAVSIHLPIFLFTIYYGSEEVGFLSFALSMLYIPVQLFGNASASIYFKKATEVYNTEGFSGLERVSVRLYWNFFGLGLLCYAVLFLIGDILFGIVFGSNWSRAGEFSIYLSLYHVFLLTSTPLNAVFSVIKQEKKLLSINVLIFIFRALLLGGAISFFDALQLVKIYSLGNLICYLFISIYILKLIRSRYLLHLLYTSLSFVLFLTLIYLTRTFFF